MSSMKMAVKRMMTSSAVGKSAWSFLHQMNLLSQRVYSDEQYFKRAYRRNCGEELDFENPKTFDAKQLWLKMYYRDPMYVRCSDKYLVRDYVTECGLEHILNPLYAVFDSVEEIDWDSLPKEFYVKTNHMSAGNLRCNDISQFDRKAAEKQLSKAMKKNYYYESREWNYKEIKPRILVEAVIESKDRSPLLDYRFLCYEGKCEYLFIDIYTADESGHHRPDAGRNVYDRDMNLLDVTVSRARYSPDLVSKPDNYDDMVRYAEILSKPFPFSRVDLYNVDGRIVFGEITFFHSGGLSRITPPEWSYKLGEDIPIEKLQQQMKTNPELFRQR